MDIDVPDPAVGQMRCARPVTAHVERILHFEFIPRGVGAPWAVSEDGWTCFLDSSKRPLAMRFFWPPHRTKDGGT